MKTATKTLLTTSAFALALNAGVAFADNDLKEIQMISEGLNLISLEEAKTKALEVKSGVVTDVDLESRNGQGWAYEVEIANEQGFEWDVYLDAKTGELLQVTQDDD